MLGRKVVATKVKEWEENTPFCVAHAREVVIRWQKLPFK